MNLPTLTLPATYLPNLPLSSYVGAAVHPVRDTYDGLQWTTERCEPDRAEYWSTYLRVDDGTEECVGDFATRAEALTFAAAYLNQIAVN